MADNRTEIQDSKGNTMSGTVVERDKSGNATAMEADKGGGTYTYDAKSDSWQSSSSGSDKGSF